MYYDVKGEGDAILLIHGTPTSAFIWRKLADFLSSSYRVYAIDLPGWGRSGAPQDFDWRLESYAGVIREFLDMTGEKSVILGVHDLGAAIGFAFLRRYPDRVSKIIVLDTFAFMPRTRKLQWRLLYDILLRIPFLRSLVLWMTWEVAVRHTDYFVSLAFYDKKLATKELVGSYRELARREADYRTFRANGVSRMWNIIERDASSVKLPTLIVWAENDFLFPVSAARKLHSEIAESTLRMVPGCGHFLQEERSDEVGESILEFLAKGPGVDQVHMPMAEDGRTTVSKNPITKR